MPPKAALSQCVQGHFKVSHHHSMALDTMGQIVFANDKPIRNMTESNQAETH